MDVYNLTVIDTTNRSCVLPTLNTQSPKNKFKNRVLNRLILFIKIRSKIASVQIVMSFNKF